MLYLDFFRVQLGVIGPGSKIKRSQLRLAPLFKKSLNIIYCRSSSFFWFWLTQKDRFLKPIKKTPYIVNYWWTGVSDCSIIFVITKIYIFLRLYFTLVSLLIMQSQPSSIARTVTSTVAFYHCWSYTEDSHLWIRCDIFYINIACPYEICEFILFLIC